MCCFSLRVSVLLLVTLISFILNFTYPSLSVVKWYFLNINIFAFIIFMVDKVLSLKSEKRVPEFGLHYFSFIGGILGAFLAMIIFKHKIKDYKFLYIQISILAFWVIFIWVISSNLEEIKSFLAMPNAS